MHVIYLFVNKIPKSEPPAYSDNFVKTLNSFTVGKKVNYTQNRPMLLHMVTEV